MLHSSAGGGRQRLHRVLCRRTFAERAPRAELLRGAESTGETLALITWVVFGGIVVVRMFDRVTWSALVYAVLSLTVVWMIPVFLCLIGTRTTTADKLFIG